MTKFIIFYKKSIVYYMSKKLEDLKGATAGDLRRVLVDYNNKLRQKEYKTSKMKKADIIKEIKKMYTWRRSEKFKRIAFLRKGKQHSFVVHLKGSKKYGLAKEAEKAAAKKKEVKSRTKKLERMLKTKRVLKNVLKKPTMPKKPKLKKPVKNQFTKMIKARKAKKTAAKPVMSSALSAKFDDLQKLLDETNKKVLMSQYSM